MINIFSVVVIHRSCLFYIPSSVVAIFPWLSQPNLDTSFAMNAACQCLKRHLVTIAHGIYLINSEPIRMYHVLDRWQQTFTVSFGHSVSKGLSGGRCFLMYPSFLCSQSLDSIGSSFSLSRCTDGWQNGRNTTFLW
jgi:hypothetical protein